MTESQLLSFLAIFVTGVIVGILATLAFNKIRSGKASAGAVKREFDDYQEKVEEHFDETSEKFKAMAEQYKDLYQHLSVGATSLCRPEHVVAGLSDQSDPLQSLPKLKSKPEANKTSSKAESKTDKKPENRSDPKTQNPASKKSSNPELKPNKSENSSKGNAETTAGDASKADLKKPLDKSNKSVEKAAAGSSKKA